MEMIYETDNIAIEYKDVSLESVTIRKNGQVLKMVYMDDELLECVLDEHEFPIEHNRLVGPNYDIDGLLIKDDDGMVYYPGNVQVLGNAIYYKGDEPGSLFTITHNLSVTPVHKYSEEMYFLLSFGYGRLVPYLNIPNLPPIGLMEFINALGEMLKQGVYLTYMDKIFNGFPSRLILDSNVDLLDKNNTDYIEAELDSCKMRMVTSRLSTTATIVDGDGVTHLL